jgi:hypothetical protein
LATGSTSPRAKAEGRVFEGIIQFGAILVAMWI